MALTGTLKDFGIAEILQLIGTQKKTGVLTLEDGKRRAEIEFSEGVVVGARGGNSGITLEERLVRAELISQAQLLDAKRKVQETLKPFAAVLLSENTMEPKELRDSIALHISEIVFETFGWKSGTYAFEQKFIQWDKQLITPMSAESIMMDGLRIVDETPVVLKVIPSLSDRYIRAKRPPTNITLGMDMQNIMGLLDGKRTVEDVVYRSGMAKFEVLKRLAKLMTQGFISLASEADAILNEVNNLGASAGKDAKPESDSLGRWTSVSVYLLLAMVSIAALFQVASLAGIPVLSELGVKSEESAGGAVGMMLGLEEARVENALETYRAVHGEYPDTMDRLVEAALLDNDEVKIFAAHGFEYKKEGQGYRITGHAKESAASAEPTENKKEAQR